MIPVEDLPALNAVLNSTSAFLLILGYGFIRRGRIGLHRACMTGAFLVSAGFLISYLIYHYHVGSRPFGGEGFAVRMIYFSVLISHIFLAAAVLPLAVLTLARAVRGRFESHKRIARWTLPVWLYVSVTGVVVYWMLYQWG